MKVIAEIPLSQISVSYSAFLQPSINTEHLRNSASRVHPCTRLNLLAGIMRNFLLGKQKGKLNASVEEGKTEDDNLGKEEVKNHGKEEDQDKKDEDTSQCRERTEWLAHMICKLFATVCIVLWIGAAFSACIVRIVRLK